MPGKIFVNYRRDDVPDGAARLRDGLAAKFGKSNVFMDVDNLLAGQRFDEELAKALSECDVLIAVIGPRWMELLRARAASAERDYVREEIAEALRHRVVVIPARVGREGQLAPLPRADELPTDIRDLVLYQKHDVAHERFGRDIAELIEAITIVRRSKRPQRGSPHVPWGWVGSTAVGVLAFGYVGAYYAGMPVPWPWAAPGVGGQTPVPTVETGPRMSAQGSDPARAAAESKRLADLAAQARRDLEAERAAFATAQAADTVTAWVVYLNAHPQGAGSAAARQRVAALGKAEDERRKAAEAKAAADAEAKRKAEEDRKRDPAMAVKPGTGQAFRDCSDGCPEMVVVPAGKFTMGEGSSAREVSINQAFAIGKFEVTFEEWEACVKGGDCASNRNPSDQGWGTGRRPVINVSWNDAKEYVAWLSRKTGKTYRLLTEAEWEYAARAGSTTTYSWGDTVGRNNANCRDCGSQWDGKRTAPVGSFKANAFGLHDMHGNVWEWCEDAYDASSRVLRGGSWFNIPQILRAANRFRDLPVNRYDNVGFRVARVLSPARTL